MAEGSKKDTVNRRALIFAFLPLVISLFAGGWFIYSAYIAPSHATLHIAIGPPGTPGIDLIESIADHLKKRQNGIHIHLQRTTGTAENNRLLAAGKVDIAMVASDTVFSRNIRLIANMFPDTAHMLVRAETGITKIHQLAGRRIGIPPQTEQAHRLFWFLIGQYGLSPEKIAARPMNARDAFLAIRSGTVDALFYVRPPANRQTRWIAEATDIHLLPIDQAAAMALRRASLYPVTIPKGLFGGNPPIPASDIKSIASQRLLVARAGAPDDVIRAVTATLFENRRDLSVRTKLAGFITRPNRHRATILPLHPGALAFYDRDQPSFWQENAEPIGVVVSIMVILSSFLLYLKRTWQERQKGRIDGHNLVLADLTTRLASINSIAELESEKNNIYNMLNDVIRELDEDKINGDGFHYFAFTWRATHAAILERENTLRQTGE